MARKKRNDVDYFPHSVRHGKKMYYMRSKYKNDGYAVWFLLLESLGKANNHFLDLTDPLEMSYLSSSFMVEEELLIDIINDLVRMEEFDRELWEKEKVLYNQTFVDGIDDAYKKRVNECVTKTSLIAHLKSIGRWIGSKTSEKVPNPTRIDDGNAQSKVKEIKEEKIKVDDTLFLCEISDEIQLEENQNIAFGFWKLFKKNLLESGISNPTNLNKAKLDNWSRTVRLMIENDKRTKDECSIVFNFLHDNLFWKKNIQSIGKLREQFERLYMDAKGKGVGTKSKNPKITQSYLEDLYKRLYGDK